MPSAPRCAWGRAISRPCSAACWCCSASISSASGLRSNEKIEGNWSLRALIVLPLSLVLFGLLMDLRGLRAGADGADLRLGAGQHASSSSSRSLLLAVGLTAFCGRAVHLGPRPALSAVRGLVTRRHGPVQQPDLRLRRRALAAEPALLLHRRLGRHADRRAAGHRPARHHRDAAADHLQRRRRSAR